MANLRIDDAALHFAKSDLPFEEVVLLLASTNTDKKPNMTISQIIQGGGAHVSALCTYLTEKLRVIPASSKSQRTMVCTWLTELLLQRISIAGLKNTSQTSQNSAGSLSKSGGFDEDDLISQFKDFIRSNRSFLDQATTLNLLIARGMRPLLLFYVKMISDYEYTLTILVGKWNYV